MPVNLPYATVQFLKELLNNCKVHNANVVIKIIKLYMNCGIIAVVMSIIIISYFLSTIQKNSG